MKLSEILDSNVDYEVTKESSSLFKTEATINGRLLSVYFTKSNQSPDHWIFEFSEGIDSRTKQSTTKLTGSGGEFQVFSLVKKVLLHFVELYHPEVVEFTASRADGNRARLYSKFMNKIKIPRYVTDQDDSYDDDVAFRLVHEDVLGEP